MTTRNWQNITDYMDTVGTSLKTFTFPKTQNFVNVTIRGNANVSYTIGSQSGTLSPGQSITVSEKITSFTLTAVSGTQTVEVWATEDGTQKVEDDSSDSISGLAVSLADITTKVLYMSHYKLLAGETTDDGRFTRMLADLHDGYILFFEANANYTLTSRKQFTQNNIKVFGCGATITYNGTDVTEVLMVGNFSKITQSSQSVAVNINSNTVTLTDVTNINIGDIFMGYNSTAINGYNDGIYASVVDIDSTNKILTLSINFHKSFTITNYSVYTSVDGVVFSDITVNCNANMKNIAFNFYNVKNSSFTNLGGNGQGGRAGITLQGLNCEVKFCKFTNFYDTALIDNQTGYGVAVSGHNINVELNNIKKCKHSLTAGSRLFYSTGIHYNKNLCYRDPANATSLPQVVDFHSNVEGTITNNEIFNVGNVGIGVRSNNVKVEGNTLYSIYSAYQSGLTLKAISCYENTTTDITIKNNKFVGYFGSLFVLETNLNTTFQNFNIEDNRADYGGIYFNAYSGGTVNIIDSIVKNNKILKEGCIQINNVAGTGNVIKDNVIYSSYNFFNININLNQATSKPVNISNNRCYHGTQGGDNIRVQNDWNIISGNVNIMSDTTTSPIHTYTANNQKANNIWIKSDGTIQVA